MKKSYRTIQFAFGALLAGLLLTGVTSCGVKDSQSPGVEFMPDMYRSPSLEYYQGHVLDGDTLPTAKLPVKGSVARGYLPYAYPNSPEGFEAATANLKNPLAASNRAQYEKEGEELYVKFCVHCHGASGAGDGKVGGKLPGPPPAYTSIQGLTEGRIFHVITYGKGMMGPHSQLLNAEERWKLVYFVQKLQNPKGAAPSDSTQTGAAGTATAAASASAAPAANTSADHK
jgi:mono/diheme cytochrome c family protein